VEAQHIPAKKSQHKKDSEKYTTLSLNRQIVFHFRKQERKRVERPWSCAHPESNGICHEPGERESAFMNGGWGRKISGRTLFRGERQR